METSANTSKTDWTLNAAQLHFIMQQLNFIESRLASDEFEPLRELAASDEFVTLFGDMGFDEAYDSYTTMQRAALEVSYDSQDWNAVFGYIEQHQIVRPLLLEAIPVLQREFPDSSLELEIAADIESGDGETLFIYIHTALEVDEAMNRLHQVDDAWFLAAGRRSVHVFNINLRFA